MRIKSVPLLALFASLLLSAQALAQNVAQWTKQVKTDPLRDVQFLQFSLDGKFLSAPRGAAPDAKPSIILRCTQGSFAHGRAHGKFLNGYIYVGAIVDTHIDSNGTSVPIQFRLDGGKLQSASWSHSTDYSSIFFGDIDLNTLMYGHFMPHKENTSPQVRKIVIGTNEYLGAEVVMQFDLPESSEVADSCGVIWHK